MYNWIYETLTDIGLDTYTSLIAYVISYIIIFIVSISAAFIVKFIVVKIGAKIINKATYRWNAILDKNRLFHRISYLTIPIILSHFSETLPNKNNLLAMLANIIIILVLLLVIDSIINSIDEIYRGFEISKVRPIRSILQVIKVATYIMGGIVVIATLIGESPMALLGGIGAMTAVTSLVFKDPILGFVAGVQLTSNDMIRIGDWIEVDRYSANGTVIDLTMTTVKVQNFDNTITSIPAYILVSDSFINWRGMQNSGARRMKREINIDISEVKQCDYEMIERLKRIDLIKGYLTAKVEELDKYNTIYNCDLSEPVNGRRVTNIGTFRQYILEYLKNHPGIHKEMTILVRQLSSGEKGLPLEIIAYTNTINWEEFESIQSDIFDHLYSIIGEFGLSVYQKPSGYDIRKLADDFQIKTVRVGE